jgi:TRAP-type C4-dicarboxylate transport system permease small subunit
VKKFFYTIDLCIEKFASWGLYIAVFGMIIFSVSTIVFRWINYNVMWFDPFVRHLVFLGTFLGGVLATGRRTHIGIDILGKYLEGKGMIKCQMMVTRLIALVSTFTLVWLVKASIEFAKIEFEFGKAEFLGIHNGFMVSIIPFGLSLIAYRFFYIFLSSFWEDFKVEGA